MDLSQYSDEELMNIVYPGAKNITPVVINDKLHFFDKSIAPLVTMANESMIKDTGAGLQIASSYRTTADQQKLYDELKPKGARVATPGKSYHEKGMALDVSNWKQAQPYLNRYGLANDLNDDKGHFSYGETRKPTPVNSILASIGNLFSPASAYAEPPPQQNLSNFSDDELAKIAGVGLQDMSDDELAKIAGVELQPDVAPPPPHQPVPYQRFGQTAFNYLKPPPVTVGGQPTQAQPLNFPYSEQELQAAQDMSIPGAFGAGALEGLKDLGMGLAQTGAAASGAVTGDQGFYDYITQQRMQGRRENEALMATRPAAQVGKFVGQVAPTALVPQAAPESLTGRVLMGSLTGAGFGATSFVPPGESRLSNAMMGAGFGGAGAAALQVPGMAYNLAAGPKETELRALSKKWGIPLTYAEETEGMASRGDILRERMPWFMGGTRNWNQERLGKAQIAARNMFAQYVVDPTIEDTAAMKLANDAHIDQLFQQVHANAPTVPQSVPVETRNVTGKLLQRYPSVFQSIQDTEVKRILKNIAGDTADQTISTGMVDQYGNAITRQVTPQFDFDTMWMLRKGIGREIGDASTNTAKGELKRLYGAVSSDIDNMLNTAGGTALDDFRAANNAFKQYSVKFDAMREAYDKAMGTTSASETFSPKKFSTELKKLANDPQYKQNVQWSQAEIDEMTGLANILQTSKRASQYLENPPTGNRWGALTTAGGAEAMLFEMGKAAGLGGATGMAAGTAAGAGLGWTARFLTTTEPGKRLAMAAAKAHPDSPAMNDIMNQIYKQVPKFMSEMSLVELPQGQELNVSPVQ